MQINNAIVNQAEADASQAGYDTSHYFTLALDANGNTALVDTDADGIPDTMVHPEREGYNGYLLGDGIPTNGAAFGHGISFPGEPQNDDFFLRQTSHLTDCLDLIIHVGLSKKTMCG